MITMSLEFNLKQLMSERNLTIQDIHEATDLSRNSISAIMNNHSKGIRLDSLERLVNYLDVPIGAIFKHVHGGD